MKKLVFILLFASMMMFSCGGKKQEGLTPEQEIQLVDSAAHDIQAGKAEIQQQVDSLSTQVDSLLQGI